MLLTLFFNALYLVLFCGFHIYSTETLSYTPQDTYLMNFMTLLILFLLTPNALLPFMLYTMFYRYHTHTFTTTTIVSDLLALMCIFNGYQWSMLFLIFDLKANTFELLKDQMYFSQRIYELEGNVDLCTCVLACLSVLYVMWNSAFIGLCSIVVFILNQTEFERIFTI